METALIIADILSAVAVALMLFVLKTNIKHEKRIQRMENDLYLNPGNPTSMPLTQQVFNLQKDVSSIKESIGKLNDMMTHFYNSNFKK
ncbi:unnamed protein product [marine sediment metagenome]|uniref:Uncharacterized protein n=1 Tax=marine sediment metagenome TaxID=412755 RepID=X1B3B2_9ZZZZ